jgi:hypothetical protein
MDVNGRHVHPRRSVRAVPPITIQQLVYDPIRMRSRETSIADETGDTTPFLHSLRNSIGSDNGQIRQPGRTVAPTATAATCILLACLHWSAHIPLDDVWMRPQ